jgi:hypothetical protein
VATARDPARGEERAVAFADQTSLQVDGDRCDRVADASGAVSDAEYATWRDVPGGRYPFSVVLSFPETRLRAELELSTVELNPRLEASLFRVAGGGLP